MKEDYSPLGIFITVFLVALIGVQAYGISDYYIEGNGEAAMFVGILSLIGLLICIPGFILGYKIFTKLKNKLVGSLCLLASLVELLIFTWALAN